jgi:glycosyltransferase involved in cell wall biosynthesis
MKYLAFIRASNIYDDSRATKEILAFLEAGYHILLLGWDRSGEAKKRCEDTFIKEKGRIDYFFYCVKIINGIGLRHISKLIGWMRWVYFTLKKFGKIDFVHACDLDSGIGAFRFCKRFKKKLVYDIFDYYVDAHSMPRLFVPLVEKVEINIINFAEITIICSEERRHQIASANPRRLLIIHNSPELEIYKRIPPIFDYVYCGSLCNDRLIKEILEKYPENCDLSFAFAGSGVYVDRVKELDRKFPNFHFFGSLPYSKVLEIESQSSIISAIYNPRIRNHRWCAPNKFYEGLALGKPLIVCKETCIDKVVDEYKIGEVINYDANEFFAAMRRLLADPNLCLKMGENARKKYEESYKWSLMKERLIEAYGELK